MKSTANDEETGHRGGAVTGEHHLADDSVQQRLEKPRVAKQPLLVQPIIGACRRRYLRDLELLQQRRFSCRSLFPDRCRQPQGARDAEGMQDIVEDAEIIEEFEVLKHESDLRDAKIAPRCVSHRASIAATLAG